ncbi:MAG: SRPBCC domain-containing protein [bacterium]
MSTANTAQTIDAPATDTTTQVYRIFIKATPQAIWDAITTPEWTERWGYGLRDDYDLRPGGQYRGHATPAMRAIGLADVVADGEVIESDPPHKLVMTWRMATDARLAAEGFTRLTYEIVEGKGGVTRLSVIHDLAGTPMHAAMVAGDRQGPGEGGGWLWILSDLKSVLEGGAAMSTAGWEA